MPVTITIENVLTDEELQRKFDCLCAINPLVQTLKMTVQGSTIRDKLNNWYPSSRPDLLKRLSIQENTAYKGLYHES